MMTWRERAFVWITIGTLVVAVLVFGTLAASRAEDGIPVLLRQPSEIEKTESLRLGYILNGFSMTREPANGSIDVSVYKNPLLERQHVPPPNSIRTIPIVPDKKPEQIRKPK